MVWIACISQGPFGKTEPPQVFQYSEFNTENLVTQVKELLRSHSEISNSWRFLTPQDGAAIQAAQKKLEWWSRWYSAGVGVIEDMQSVQGGRVREGGHLTFPFSPLLLKVVWKPVEKPTWEITCNIEKGQRRHLRANIGPAHYLSYKPVNISLSHRFLKGAYFLKRNLS